MNASIQAWTAEVDEDEDIARVLGFRNEYEHFKINF